MTMEPNSIYGDGGPHELNQQDVALLVDCSVHGWHGAGTYKVCSSNFTAIHDTGGIRAMSIARYHGAAVLVDHKTGGRVGVKLRGTAASNRAKRGRRDQHHSTVSPSSSSQVFMAGAGPATAVVSSIAPPVPSVLSSFTAVAANSRASLSSRGGHSPPL
eukprot:NODE_18961_length_866_cov_3.487145.p1 GENE.NODE_18961_length_866_cov_3.487145~~NODE_18961_length_866_cov_3.487145.p1  ORF type:complete len:159 (+),score=24.42 NODE_18961_length_866_cov_3.487145:375-851(+)